MDIIVAIIIVNIQIIDQVQHITIVHIHKQEFNMIKDRKIRKNIGRKS